MEQREGFGPDGVGRPAADSTEDVVSSRGRALAQLQAAVEAGDGPALITGEAGAGKTWLAGKLADQLESSWEIARVDLSGALTAVDFLRLIAHDVGVTAGDGVGELRIRLRQALQDDVEDGRRWLLIIDEAHRGAARVWDEIQAIANQLGRQEGFGGLVVLGQTELLGRLAERRYRGLASSLSLHEHLPPLDLEEARELIGLKGRPDPAVEAALNELHRAARGNPALCAAWRRRGRPSGFRASAAR